MTARTDYLEAALLVWRDIADQLAKAVKADPNPGQDAMAALDLHGCVDCGEIMEVGS